MSARLAGIYCRISRDKTGAGLGVDRQESDCRAMTERLGWDVAKVYVDNDISAYSGKVRPRYEELLTDLESGKITGVVTWHPDRLHRSPTELERYIALAEQQGIETHSVQTGHWDLSTPAGRMNARNIGNFARYESEHKSERIKRARQQSAKRGEWHGGRRCFGWEPDGMTPRESEAKILRSAADSIIAGVSLRQIVSELNKSGVPTTTGGKPWESTKLRAAILAPRNAGLSAHKGEIVGKAKWPAIIDESKWTAVRAILTDPGRRTNGRGGSVRWLGSGLYICGVCGSNDVRMSIVEGRRRYRCRNRVKGDPKPHVGRDASMLDAYVEGLIVARLSEPDAAVVFADPGGGVDVGALHVESRALSERLDSLAGMFAEGAITSNQLATGSEKIRVQQESIAGQIAAAAMTSPITDVVSSDDVAAAWSKLALGTRREILRQLAVVTILPVPSGRRPGGVYFDVDGIRIDWLV